MMVNIHSFIIAYCTNKLALSGINATLNSMHFTWQDMVLSACILGFNIALVPTLLSKHKPHASTGIMTAAFQLICLVVYVSLSLWYSAAMALLNATLWSIIVAQKLMMKPAKKRQTRKLKSVRAK